MSDDDRVQRTDDGRFIIVDGRRWRATDPSLEDDVRQLFVDQLMRGRRAVRQHAANPDLLRAARSIVHDAKVALGERGTPWWETTDESSRIERSESIVRTLARTGDVEATRCAAVVESITGERLGESAVRRLMKSAASQG